MDSIEQLITGKKEVGVSTLARVETLIMTCGADRERFMVRLMEVDCEEDAQALIGELLKCQPIPGRDYTPHTVVEQGRAIQFAADLDDFKEERKMKNTDKDQLQKNLEAIRTVVDTNCEGVDIEDVISLGQRLSALMGLSAECKSQAKERMERARLASIKKLMTENYPPSVTLKMAEAEISEQSALYEYADRLSAAITHQIDYLRTVISWRKTEFENSVK